MTNLAAGTMPALYALAELRAAWLVFLMWWMTWFGDGVVFAAVGVTAYWCWDKRAGEYMLSVGLAGPELQEGGGDGRHARHDGRGGAQAFFLPPGRCSRAAASSSSATSALKRA